MISAVDIQNAYINLYKELRKYIWSAEMVEAIVDLEIAVYETFPDMNRIRKHFKAVKSNLYDIFHSDDKEAAQAMKDVVSKFEEMLTDEVGYSRIEKVQEAL